MPFDRRREKVAKAIYDQAMDDMLTAADKARGTQMRPWSDRSQYTKDEYRRLADAAIGALREVLSDA